MANSMSARSRVCSAVAVLPIVLAAAACGQDPAVSPAPGAPTPTAAGCAYVSAPLATLSTHVGEPRLRVPQPAGWEPSAQTDTGAVRLVMVDNALRANGFAPSVTVSVEVWPGQRNTQQLLALERNGLAGQVQAASINATAATLCGAPAQLVTYTIAAHDTARAHTATALSAVGRTATNTYAVTVTIETADPNSSTYQKDSAAILTGFELVAPGGMQPASN